MLAHRLEKTCDVNSVQNLFTLRYSRELPKAMRKTLGVFLRKFPIYYRILQQQQRMIAYRKKDFQGWR
jgi:hypothetical protein